MNTPEPYERQADPSPAAPDPPTGTPEVATLAVHNDPSLQGEQTAAAEAGEQPHASIAWVRPTELIASVGSAPLRQVADAQADVVRRVSRAPLAARFRLRGRDGRASIAGPDQTVRAATPMNGVEL